MLNVVRNVGIDMSNTYAHTNTPASISCAYMAMSDSTMSYTARSASGQSVSKGFFKQED